jgi:hypothetical protein
MNPTCGIARRFTLAFVLILALALGAAQARADEASKTAKVEEYFRLARLDASYDQTIALMLNQFWTAISRQIQNSAPQALAPGDVDGLKQVLQDVLGEGVGWDKMKPDYVKMYSEAFTEEEMEAIVVFYRSPAGQQLVTKTPEIVSKTVAISQRRMAELQPTLQAAVRNYLQAKMDEKRQNDAQQAPAPPPAQQLPTP